MKKTILKTTQKIILLIVVFSAVFFSWKISNRFEVPEAPSTSSLGSSLEIFTYNQSQHNDPVKNCWYDSGDYVVFLQRNVESLYYLSLAHQQAQKEAVRSDLWQVIDQQLPCAEEMLAKNLKQFRDQRSHGQNYFPPRFSDVTSDDEIYTFRENEGKDIHLLLSLTYRNLGDDEKADEHLEKAESLADVTITERCCEEGPLQHSYNEYIALQALAHDEEVDDDLFDGLWGVNFIALAHLNDGHQSVIRALLKDVKENWSPSAEQFDYIGGNYDIAGITAMESLYRKQFEDEQFHEFSDELWVYLEGENEYRVDFLNYEDVYHPCYFFNACELNDTLINGRDKTGFDPDRRDVWRNTEVQLVGHAQFILARVLYEEL